MKSLKLLSILILGVSSVGFTQDVQLANATIYFDNKPVALYTTSISKNLPRYNVEVSTLNGMPVIKAEVIEFAAPVTELKPFYYYELQFPTINERFSIYYEGEAFPMALAKLMAEYKLIAGDAIDTAAVKHFKETYEGRFALMARIFKMIDYLNLTRNFDDQVSRDRTKPVTILNERVIMQDGVQIGTINTNTNYKETSIPIYAPIQVATFGKPVVNQTYVADHVITGSTETEIHISNGHNLDIRHIRNDFSSVSKNSGTGYHLFQISQKDNYPLGSGSEDLLHWICFLIEDYDL
jgi:hypothetical protein